MTRARSAQLTAAAGPRTRMSADDRTRSSPAAMWDDRYRPAAYAYGLEPNAFLAAQAHRLKPGMRALVPGDGEGRNGVWLAGQGLAVDTFDLSAFGVAKAKALARSAACRSTPSRPTRSRGTGRRRATTDRADLSAPRRARAAHRPCEGAEALKPGGLIVLEAFRPEQLSATPPGRAAARATRRCSIRSRRCGRIFPARKSCCSRRPRRGWTKGICTSATARSCGRWSGRVDGETV